MSLSLALLAFSSVKAHLAVVSAHHELLEGSTVFSHKLSYLFLKGLLNIYPSRSPVVPQWSLSFSALRERMLKPFESLASFPLLLVSTWVAFWVAITLDQRVRELAALKMDPLFLKIHY